MDFRYGPEEESFRQELLGFIRKELPPWWRGMFLGDGDQVREFTRSFCKKLAARGWLTLSWPKEYGGSAASHWKQAVLREEMWAHLEPRGPQYMNLNYIGPCIMFFGTEEQKRRHLSPMARGELIWCQGFSEPDAGSDLASVKTRATEDGDDFVINGQKIWTSYADWADWCFMIARTDPNLPKHKGLSVFLVDMKTPGITVRPIEGMTGFHEVNEVFFDNVRVPRSSLLGEKNGGWKVIMTGLNFERTGVARYWRAKYAIDRIVRFCKAARRDGRPLSEDPVVRQKIAQIYIDYEAARLLNYRIVSMQEEGAVPTYEASVARLHATSLEQKVAAVGCEIAGLMSQLEPGAPYAPEDGMISYYWKSNVPTSIGAGTTEIQKNIVAQRGLGLPRGD